jgi:hypothetical protein
MAKFHEIRYEYHVAEGHPDTISLKFMPSHLKYDRNAKALGGVNIGYSAENSFHSRFGATHRFCIQGRRINQSRKLQ